MRLKVGDEVRLTIHDHCKHSGTEAGILTFNVYGRVLSLSEDTVVVGTWCYEDNDVDDNVECFSISRGAIKKVRVYK